MNIIKKSVKEYNRVAHVIVGLCLSLLLISSFSTISFAQESDSDVEKGENDQSKSTDDVLYLQSRIYGDKEQPLVSYFIPWKGTQSPDNLLWQLERKNDDTLNLVDRDIMLRSINIYGEMQLEKK